MPRNRGNWRPEGAIPSAAEGASGGLYVDLCWDTVLGVGL